MKKPDDLIISYAQVVNDICQKHGYDKDRVRRTIETFFLGFGLRRIIKKGDTVRIKGFGIFRPNRKRKQINKRKERVLKITERFKKNNYNRKKQKTKMKAKPSTGAEFKSDPLTIGAHRARCFAIIDMGTNLKSPYPKREIMTCFECVEPQDIKVFSEEKGPQPKMAKIRHGIKVEEDGSFSINWEKSNIGKFYADFLGEERLTQKVIESWDFTAMINKTGNVVIQHVKDKKDPKKIYDNISGAYPPTEGQKYPKLQNNAMIISIDDECMYYDVASGKTTKGTIQDVMPLIWPWLQKALGATPEYKARWGTFTPEATEEIEADALGEAGFASDDKSPF